MKCIGLLIVLSLFGCGGSGGDTSVTVNQNQSFNSADECFDFCRDDQDCVEQFNCFDLPSDDADNGDEPA